MFGVNNDYADEMKNYPLLLALYSNEATRKELDEFTIEELLDMAPIFEALLSLLNEVKHG